VADYFVPGVYHIVLDTNPDVHLLEDNLSEDHILVLKPLTVHDVCSAEVVVLQEFHTVEQIAAVLLRTTFSTYPILDRTGKVLGAASRVQLAALLQKERYKESINGLFSVLSTADKSPSITLWSTSVDRAFRHFTACGLTHMMVVSESQHLLGILTRTDLARLCHDGEHGVAEVRAILERKKRAMEAGEVVASSKSLGLKERLSGSERVSGSDDSSPSESGVYSESSRSCLDRADANQDDSSSGEASSPSGTINRQHRDTIT
jgi:CBS domain-containing protein